MKEIILIIIYTLLVYWTIGIIIGIINEDLLTYYATGIIYPIILFILYPIRKINTYNRSKGYYQKNGITKIQFLFGKKVKTNRNDENERSDN